MIKKHFTPKTIILLWGFTLLFILNNYNEYVKYFLILSLPVIIPLLIFNLIKQRREDQINNTTLFKSTIYRMLIVAVILVAFFFISKQNYM